MKSALATDNVQKSLEKYRDRIVHDNLAAKNLPETALKPFEIKEHNVAPPKRSAARPSAASSAIWSSFFVSPEACIPPWISLPVKKNAAPWRLYSPSSPIARVDLVFGKFFLVLTTALVTAALSVTSMGVSFAILWSTCTPSTTAPGADAAPCNSTSSWFSTVLSIFITGPAGGRPFLAAGVMTVSLFAKSYKEAQSYVSPLMIIVIIPAVAAMLPIDLTAKLALVPILNASLLCKELVTGTYHWNFIAIIFSSTCVYAAAALFLAVKMFQRESVLFRS